MSDDKILIIEDLEDLFEEAEEEVLPEEEELPVSGENRKPVPLSSQEPGEVLKGPHRPAVQEDRTPVPVSVPADKKPVPSEIRPLRTPDPVPQKNGNPRRVPRKRGRKAFPWKKVIVGLIIVGVLGAAGAYGYGVTYYTSHFLPNTRAEGVVLSNLTVQEAEHRLSEEKAAEDALFTLITKEGEEIFDTAPLHLRREYQGIEEALSVQKKWTFLFDSKEIKELHFEYEVAFDEKEIEGVVRSLSVCAPENTVLHEDSYVYQDRDGKYKIKEAIDGNEIDQEILSDAIRRAVYAKENRLDIAETGAYIICDVREDDGILQKTARIENSYEAANVTIDLGAGCTVRIKPDEFRAMTAERAESGGENPIDEEGFDKYMEKLSRSYTTKSGSGYRYFKSITGEKPVVYTDFGWEMDREATKEALRPAISAALKECLEGAVTQAAEERIVTAVWTQEGISHGERDTGDTWVEVDLTKQKMRFVENGKLLIEADCVTGKDTASRRTPPGIFTLRFKTVDRYLVGYNPDGSESYRSHVNYWMPFNKNIGLHDATWRGSFGGTIYKYSGSHGCVNLPLRTAKELYQHVYKGMAVIVYK